MELKHLGNLAYTLKLIIVFSTNFYQHFERHHCKRNKRVISKEHIKVPILL